MKNLTPVIFFVIACSQKVFSRRLYNALDDNAIIYEESRSAEPYPVSGGDGPRSADYDASDGHLTDHRVIFPDVDWSDAVPDWIAQRKIRQCITYCLTNIEYEPVCGTDSVTYRNLEHLQCFMRCGVDVELRQMSPCPGWSDPTPTTPAARPTSSSLQACMSSCPTTREYNPVCGSDRVTYENHGKLMCAQFCGKDVQLYRRSPCSKRKSTVEPATSTTATPRSSTWNSLGKIHTCMTSCPTDPQYHPVCGTNQETYFNLSRLQCAISCGADVSLLKPVPCHIEVNSSTDNNKENDDENYDIDIRGHKSAL